ncbi:unnamed protein product [Heligmosomoides polygyrus]|uniref:C2H2-type domain-containing protein n=1 Tax=Heligmosomoides polygyrus TaxID=6339 RepID=A0A3P8B1F0_HELPZ|nr:unnamed protein product [Heligmosomoides polygyrus]
MTCLQIWLVATYAKLVFCRLTSHSLRKHVRHHSGEKYCACPFCGRFFSRPDKLYEHLRKRAPIPEDGLCLLCQRRFGDERSLVNHVRRHINGRQCPTCGLANCSEWPQINPLFQNAPERPYLCHICDSKYATGHGLTRHLSRKHECPIPEGFSRWVQEISVKFYYVLGINKRTYVPNR